MNCPSCAASNDPSHKFCAQCGAALAATAGCRSCGAEIPAGSRFCTSCGASVAARPPDDTGYVADGEWRRAPGELVRRVPPDALRSAFTRWVPGVDWDAFLGGTLAGKLADALLSRTIRVPFGSIGALTRDGVVVRVLPPGEQTSPGLLRSLFTHGSNRFVLHLVDTRPIPVSFTSEAPTPTGTATLGATALVSVGTHPDALGAFLSDIVGDRDALSAEDLYLRLRGEIERAVADGLRARSGDVPGAERAARDALAARFGARSGLRFELTLAPRHAVHRLDVLLEDGLLSQDGAKVALDLALSVRGPQTPAPPVAVLQSAAARHLRGLPWASVDLDALTAALSDAGGEALRALGYELLSLQVLDVRSAGDQWALGTRAALAQARAEVGAGREWLTVRDEQIALESLQQAAALRAVQTERDARFAARQAELAHAQRLLQVEAGERAVAEQRAQGDHAGALAEQARRAELARAAGQQTSEAARRGADDRAYEEEKRREQRVAELTAMAALEAQIAEREHRQKLETMDRLAGQSEAAMIAMQAGDLAAKEHGGAFAQALGQLLDGAAAQRERQRADEAARESARLLTDLAKAALGARSGCPSCGAALAPGAKFCGGCGATL